MEGAVEWKERQNGRSGRMEGAEESSEATTRIHERELMHDTYTGNNCMQGANEGDEYMARMKGPHE